MNRSLLFAALLAGTVLAPQIASADAMSSQNAMAAPTTMWVCHTPTGTEKATAMTTASNAPLTCKPVDMHKMMTGPDMSGVKTLSEADKAWRDFLSIQMNTR